MLRLRLLALALLAVTTVASACGDGGREAKPGGESARPRLVVTTSILGSLVAELAGATAEVSVLMPDGVDPHDWQPSARDVEAIHGADIVVANGLDLEEGLTGAIAEAERAGVAVFRATDHVELRTIGEEHGEEEPGAGSEDPHVWTSPAAMREVVSALAASLVTEVGLDVGERASDLEARLDELDREIERALAGIAPERRKLVTGHESMGYFADRYRFELIGAIIPGLSSQAEASAADLARLAGQVRAAGASVVFIEIGTPRQLAEAIAEETGATVVELPSHNLPDDGSYFTFMRALASEIAGALAVD